ncbi:hypothetical protein LC087_00795 [Bacillus carboniphilus]|uniref:Uncharacterized protein n=1 Tax=Bacillus carboniphilus TaxID=86663 RepID=A0ABY9JTU7_9BACI|nr:hypothetical protein [Bacillus carboniphilus]WLR42814.1 hypothetical protein LC087_00795 [Bacillus carboniphilus]
MNSGKLLKVGDLSFKMFKEDGKIYIKIKNKNNEILTLREYEKYRKQLQQNLGGKWKWDRNFVAQLMEKGVPLYDENVLKRFRNSSSKFINSQFDDLTKYVQRLDESFLKVAGTTFKEEMKIWESFKGWKGGSKLTKLGKSTGIAGIGLTFYDNATGTLYNEKTGQWEFNDGEKMKKFAVDTSVDLVAGAGAMALGAAAGSFFLPPLGTAVGAVAGAGIYAVINLKISWTEPPKSVVDVTKDVANETVDTVREVASKTVDAVGNLTCSIGNKLDKVFW